MICDISRIQKIADEPAQLCPSDGGVYAIVNRQTLRAYIGQTRNIAARVSAHKSALRTGKHPNKELQTEWDQHGEAHFRFGVVAILSADLRVSAEQELISAMLGDALFNRSVCGRPEMPADERHGVRFELRLTAEQKETLLRMGGADWLRSEIARAP